MEMQAETKEEQRMIAIVHNPAIKAINGIRGKICAQTGHAFLHSFWDAEERHPERANAYKHSGAARKITLICEDEKVMRELVELYRPITGVTVVEDMGLTVFHGKKTFTCVGIGPIKKSEQIDDILHNLKLFS